MLMWKSCRIRILALARILYSRSHRPTHTVSPCMHLEDHFRIAHQVAVLFSVMANGNEAVAVTGLPMFSGAEASP
jgi:hypothetical protein